MTPAHADGGVLVVGGGFAGFWAALAARRVLGAGVPVTLVSELPVLQLRPRLHEARPQDGGVPLAPLLARCGVGFVQASVLSLDPEARRVQLAGGEALPWQRLVLAAGSRMVRPQVPGAEVADSIDTQAEAIAFDQRLATIATREAAPVLAVVGAGFTGLELALALRDRVAGMAGAARAEATRIVLVDRATRAGAELGPGPRPAIDAALARQRIETCLWATLERIEPCRLLLQGRPPLAVHATVLATGQRAAPLAAQVPGEHDALGRVVVDGSLRAPAAPGVFVAGDAAAADTGGGRLALQSCQHALRMGRFAGENAALDLLGQPLRRYAQPQYVTCLDLGPDDAVFTEGWQRELRCSGAAAKAIKQRINGQVIVPPSDASGEQLLELSRVDAPPEPA